MSTMTLERAPGTPGPERDGVTLALTADQVDDLARTIPRLVARVRGRRWSGP
jgi:hypothetical protein